MADDKKELIETITSPVIPPETIPAKLPEVPADVVVVVSENDLLGGPSEPVTPKPPEVPAGVATDANQPQPAQAAVNGEPVKRGRGRPKGSTNRPQADFSDVTAAAAATTLVDYKLMAGALFDMSAGVLTNTLGPEWQPRSVEERGTVCSALEIYLQTKQAKDIPPGLMLTIVVVAYAAPRLQAPSTKEKLMPMISWGWLKVKSFFSKRKPAFHIVPATDKQ